MERIKNKNLIKSILVTLSLVLTLSFGLILFKDNVNVVSADSVEVELDSQVNKVTSSSTAPTIDSSYFDVTSPNWSSKFDFLATQSYNSFNNVTFNNSQLRLGFVGSDTFQELDGNWNTYDYVYFNVVENNGSKTLTSRSDILTTSWGVTEIDNYNTLWFGIENNNVAKNFFIGVSDYIIVTMANNQYYITCSPSLYSQYNAYLKGLTGSSLTENELYQNGYNVGYNKGFNDGNNNVINNPNNYDLYSKYQYDTNYTNGKNDGITIGQNNVKDNPNNYDLYTKTQYDSNYTNGKNIGYSTGYNKGVAESNDYTFLGLIGSVIDAPIQAFTNLFNFDLLGFNLLNFVRALFTLTVIIIVARFILAKM